MKFRKIRPLGGVWHLNGKGYAYGQCIVIGINRKEKYLLVREGGIPTGRKKRVKFSDVSIISVKELKSHCQKYEKRSR